MPLPRFRYLEPKTLKGAVRALALDPRGSALLAGGTDLLVNMKHGLTRPQQVINLKKVPGLAILSESKDGIKIGALTPLHDIASSAMVREKQPALCQAARDVGGYAHRVMGTLGGNLCQSNRCRYYNQSAFWRSVRPACYKAGGKMCYVVRKPGSCHSTYCGDLAPVLIALGSRVKVVGPEGERTFPLERLYSQKGKKPLSLKNGEILKEVLVPPPSGTSLYLKMRQRDGLEFPIVSMAIHLDKAETGRVRKTRIVFSGVGCGPVEARESEKLLKASSLDEQGIEKVSSQVTKEVSPMRTSLTSPAFKRKMAGILLKQALQQLARFPS
jgi:4-hydroxybenzoyl-CoA reductase subunit beta